MSFVCFFLPFQIEPHSVAARDGRIHEGDQILQVPYINYMINTYYASRIVGVNLQLFDGNTE